MHDVSMHRDIMHIHDVTLTRITHVCTQALRKVWQQDPMGADNLSIILPFPYEPYQTLLRTPRHQLCFGGSEGLGPAHPPPFPQRAITHVHISHSN